MNQKCLIYHHTKQIELLCIPSILVLIKGEKTNCVLHLTLGNSQMGRGLYKLVLNIYQKK